ncbi:hypothetical protein BC628DRAFT_1339297 [Trametes gibbosa]|nr:hypothetical protein BC628DRAFT_1339297 [Trametes gibbosa]
MKEDLTTDVSAVPDDRSNALAFPDPEVESPSIDDSVLPTLDVQAQTFCNDLPPPHPPTRQHSHNIVELVVPDETDAMPHYLVLSCPCSPPPEEHARITTEKATLTTLVEPTPHPLLPAQDEKMQVDFSDDSHFENIGMTVDIPDYGVELDLPPSSPPLSSPPHIFSSSPPRDPFGTPPSSSPPLPDLDETISNKQSACYEANGCVKRPATTVEGSESEADENDRIVKRRKLEPHFAPSDPPQPKRLTQASVAKQHKKLAAPFRSPVVKGPLVQGGLHAVYATGRPFTSSPLRKPASEDGAIEPAQRLVDVKPDLTLIKPDPSLANKDRTANAAKQFKSPLVSSSGPAGPSTAVSGGGTLFSTTKAAPTIQALQGKLQMLKQAIKIKSSVNGDEEDELERLVSKWTTAGREVAWAVWDYVKDLDPGIGAAGEPKKDGWFADGDGPWGVKCGEKRGFEAGWGYDDGHQAKKPRLDEGLEAKAEVDEDVPPVVQHTLGTMLRHLGIDPVTLGWDEEEGDFVDA